MSNEIRALIVKQFALWLRFVGMLEYYSYSLSVITINSLLVAHFSVLIPPG